MKIIKGFRDKSLDIKTYTNGDITDAQLGVYEDDKTLFLTNHASTYPSKMIEGMDLFTPGPKQGGILPPGIYNYVCGNWGAPLYKSLRLSFPGRNDLIVLSMRPNYAYHQGLMICEDVRIHSAMIDLSGNGSASCQTIYPTEYAEFINLFALGETGTFELI